MSETIVVGNDRPKFTMPLPKDLDGWVLVRTGAGERYIGKAVTDGHWPTTADGCTPGMKGAIALSPAYEYLVQLQINAGKINPPARLLIPLDLSAGLTSLVVNPTSVAFLSEAGDGDRRQWLALIEAAENLRKQVSMSQLGFVAASGDALKGLANGASRP